MTFIHLFHVLFRLPNRELLNPTLVAEEESGMVNYNPEAGTSNRPRILLSPSGSKENHRKPLSSHQHSGQHANSVTVFPYDVVPPLGNYKMMSLIVKG